MRLTGGAFGVILGSWSDLGGLLGVLGASWRRLDGVLGRLGVLGASDHVCLCLKAGPGPLSTWSC